MELKIYSQDKTLRMTVSSSDSSTHVHELMGENVVNVSFTCAEYVQLNVNDYIELDGQRYTVRSAYQPTQKSTLEYTYNVKFYGRESETQRVKMLYLTDGNFEPKFSLDGSPAEHLQKVIDNLNRISGSNTWVLGSVISAPNKNIEYNNVRCSDALSLMSEAFETEWWIEGNTINLSRCEYGDLVELGYMKGLTELNREENANDVKFFTRLIPLGTTRNIDKSSYGFSRLQLPDRAKYVEQNTEYGLYEEVEEEAFSAIYPHRVGEISSTRSEEKTGEDKKKFTIYYFKDSDLTFNPNDYDMEGLVKHVVFQSGELNGRDFEVNYNATEKEFEIITQFPDESSQLPGGRLVPDIGNKYILYNLKMPTEYITAAETEYKKAVDDYLSQFSVDSAIYRGNTDYIYIAEKNISLRIGRRVRLLSDKFFPGVGYRDSRITKITRKLNNLAQVTIECTNAVGKGRLATIESDMTAIKNVIADKLEDTVLNILHTWDSTDPTDYNVLSAKRSMKEIKQRSLSRLYDDTAEGDITFKKEIKVEQLATIARCVVDMISSPTFVDGFTGEGFQIWKSIATGDWNMTIDNLTIRKMLTIFEILVQKIRAVGGMLVVSAADGKIETVERVGDNYVITFASANGFQPNDLIRHQVFTGQEVTYYWTEVKEVTGDKVIIPVSEFEGIIPQVDEECVLMGNTKNPLRQSLITIAATEDGQPRIDVLTSVNKKSFEGNLAVRLGNMDGIKDTYFPGDNQPHGDGLYGRNCYLRGTFLLTTGEDVLTKFTVMENLFRSEMESLRNEIQEKDNYLSNSAFASNTDKWGTTNDVRFFTVNNKLLYFNSNFYSEKKQMADIIDTGSRKVLRIKASGIKQSNSDLSNKPDKESSFFVSFRIKVLGKGMVTVGFQGQTLYHTEVLEPTDGFIQKEYSGTWNGTGDFELKFTGDAYLYSLALTDNAISDMYTHFESKIEQTDRKIELLAKATSESDAEIKSSISVMAEGIELINEKTDALGRDISSVGIKINGVEGSLTSYVRKDGVVNSINLDPSGAVINANRVNLSAYTPKDGVIAAINLDSSGVEINASKINLNGAVTISSLNSGLKGTIEGKANSEDLGVLAGKDAIGKDNLDTTIIIGGYLNTGEIKVREVETSDINGNILRFNSDGITFRDPTNQFNFFKINVSTISSFYTGELELHGGTLSGTYIGMMKMNHEGLYCFDYLNDIHARFILDKNGLSFYDRDGVLTKKYSAR